MCNCALLLSDFTEKPLRFRFHTNNTTTTFEEECRIRNIDESKSPSYVVLGNRNDNNNPNPATNGVVNNPNTDQQVKYGM